MTKKKAIKMSITVQPEIKELCDSILTPSGFPEVTKGTYSKLINRLLSDFLAEHYKIDWFTVIEAYSNVGCDEEAVNNWLQNRGSDE